MACPEAGEEILAWVGEKGLSVPALPLQSALIQCCVERPQLLLPYVQHAEGPLREVPWRVLGEVATPSLGLDLLQFVGDDLDELRAAAPGPCPTPSLAWRLTFSTSWLGIRFGLSACARSSAWETLRSAGDSLFIARTDGLKRLVRLRAAEALVELETRMAPIFEQVVETVIATDCMLT